MDTAPRDGSEVDLWAWNKKLYGTDARVRGGLGKRINRRTMGWRLTGYHFCQTHKCWRRTEDYHYVNKPNDEYFDIAFWMPAPSQPIWEKHK